MEENKSISENINDIFTSFNNEDVIKGFTALMNLPDEQFNILRPLIQENIEDSLKEPETRLTIFQELASQKVTPKQFIEQLDSGLERIPELDDISDTKKDFLVSLLTNLKNLFEDSMPAEDLSISIPIEICRENIKLPTYASDGSAAMDIYSPEEYNIEPGQTVLIPTGLKVDIPKGYALLIHPRSGLSLRSKLRIANSIGLIDSDYHEEIGVIVENTDVKVKDVDQYMPSDHFEIVKEYGSPITIGKGERFAQMRLVQVPRIQWNVVKSLGTFESDHGEGFGGSGKY